MAKIRISVHPLCYFFALYYIIAGNFLVFFIYTICALLHELGHSFISSIKGYRLDKICLMPYGAVVLGESEDMNTIDSILIALAGPMLNLLISLVFISLWWIFPLTYAYTDVIVEANMSLCIVNLLPLPSLDGGRIVNAIMVKKFGEKATRKINIIVGICSSLGFIVLFVLSCFSAINITFLLFAIFLIVSLFDNKSKSRYIKIYLSVSEKSLRRGLPIIKTAISGDVPLKKLFSVLKTDCINEVDVYVNGMVRWHLGTDSITKLLEDGNRNVSIKENLKSVKV